MTLQLKIASQHVKALMEFQEMMKLVKRHGELSRQLEHLEKRYQIDRISDPQEGVEIKKEIKKVLDELGQITKKLEDMYDKA